MYHTEHPVQVPGRLHRLHPLPAAEPKPDVEQVGVRAAPERVRHEVQALRVQVGAVRGVPREGGLRGDEQHIH
jgi:hypothetical protein